jgi:hypothetical protein
MHDNIMGFQLIPISVFYLFFLAALDWVRAENAPAYARRR